MAIPLGTRKIGDIAASRQGIYDSALAAASSMAPISNQKYTLSLHDLGYAGSGQYSKAAEKKAILSGDTLSRKLRGTWRLTNNETGEVADEQKMLVAQIPYLTQRGTFTINGTDYGLANQLRLRPGIFTREKSSGELQSHVNVAGHHQHQYLLDPATGAFSATFGQSKVPIMPILRALGATDKDIRAAWGNEVFGVNVRKNEPAVIKKLYNRFYPRSKEQGINHDSMVAGIRETFDGMALDPDVMQRTLGQPFSKVDAPTILSATKRLLDVMRGEAKTDDRDSMAYQRMFGVDGLISERFAKSAPSVLNKILWRATFPGNLSKLPTGAFSDAVQGAIMKTGLGSVLTSINPSEIMDQLGRVTRMGEGGITSTISVPRDSRAVQPSHLGFIDPILTPENERIGVDLRVAQNTIKDAEGNLYSQFLTRDGKSRWVDAREVSGAVLAFPGELESGEENVRTISNGVLGYSKREEVDFQLPDMTEAFSPLANLVPMKSAIYPQRSSMGSRMTAQALPLIAAEAPLVQSGIGGVPGISFEEIYGENMGAVHADIAGTVVSVDANEIKVRGVDKKVRAYELWENLPHNRKTLLHNTALVSPGMQVEPGQLLAKSNYTDDKGVTALGVNARVAYLSYRGENYEDAFVISESFAKRTASEHMYQQDFELGPSVRASKKGFISVFPGMYKQDMLEKYDDDGVVKTGSVVNMDEPLILAIKEKSRPVKLGRRRRSWDNASTLWEHNSPGLVTDVHKGKKAINVIVKSVQATEVADKFSGRHGNKGVLAKILPDEEMPHDEKGVPYDILLNPLGIISRGNPAQIIEAALGKVAAKTGKPYKVQDFRSTRDLQEWALQELHKHGLKDKETVIDPATGVKIPGVMTGNRFIMKLHHTAESKMQGRGLGQYTSELTPAKGGVEGSKRIGHFAISGLLSHSANSFIRDAGLVRGQKNDDYWRQVMSGYNPTVPETPFVFQKFLSQLQAAGINPVRKGMHINVMALTNKDVDVLTGGRELQSAETVDWKGEDLKPIKGGLFDPTLTGSHGGKKWSQISLAEPMPNPVLEEPIRRLLGLTEKEFRGIIGGSKPIELNGATLTGPSALKGMLERINVDKELAQTRERVKSSKRTTRDKAVRKLKYLKALKRQGMHPREWMMDKVPVLPPIFRPIAMLHGTKSPLVDDSNYLYKELFEANKGLKRMTDLVDDTSDERIALYDAFKAVTGIAGPVHPKLKDQKVTGVLAHVFGCYDEQTEVLTKRGWLRFSDLTMNDEVMTLAAETGTAEWQAPTAIQQYRYQGEMFRFIHGKRVDLLLTPNHRNWIKRRQKGSSANNMSFGWAFEPAYVTAAVNTARYWLRTSADSWQGHRERPAWLAADADLGDFAEFVGWWLAEGHLDKDGHRNRVCICQSTASAGCARITQLFSSLQLAASHHDNWRPPAIAPVRRWMITHAEFATWLRDNCGEKADKFMSRWIMDWDNDLLMRLLLGYLGGDGAAGKASNQRGTHKNNKRTIPFIGCTTTAFRLADSLMEVAVKVGLTIRFIKSRKTRPGYRPQQRIGLSGSRFAVSDNGHAYVEQYDGHVYCCTVPNGIIYVRRNGKPVFSGNSGPKYGVVSRKLIGTSVDLVGRATITPNPDLDMDEVGIPVDKAWTIYQPYVIRRLVRGGMPGMRALQAVKDREVMASDALQKEMKARPVVISRDPILHKFGIMAAWPKLTKSSTLQIPPIVTPGYGADFDGDGCINTVFFAVDKLRYGADNTSVDHQLLDLSKELPVPGYLKKAIPALQETEGRWAFFVANLEDFPRTDNLIGTKGHIDFYTVPEGIRVIAHSNTDGLQLARVSGWSIHHDREVWIVTLAGSRQIITDDDERAVYGIDGDTLRWCRRRPSECKRQFVPIVADAGLALPEITEVPLVVSRKHGRGAHTCVSSMPLNEGTGYLMGAIVGYGWCCFNNGRPHAINLANNCDEIAQAFYREISALLLDKPKMTSTWLDEDKLGNSVGSFRHTIGTTVLADILDPMIGHGAQNKHLPNFTLAAPESFRKGLLAGLFDTDGSFSISNAKKKPQFMSNYTSTSIRLVQEIQHLLRTFGVTATITPFKTPKDKSVWILTPSTPELHSFGHLPLLHPEKKAKWNKFISGPCPDKAGAYSRYRLVPVPVALAIDMRKKFKGTSKDKMYSACSDAKQRGYLSKEQAVRLLAAVEERGGCSHPLYEDWAALVRDPNLVFCRVEKVEQTGITETVYDLTVPGYETFMSVDGIVLSNTMNFHVPASDEAVKEVIENMLPSRNLFSPANFTKPTYTPTMEYVTGLWEATTKKDRSKRTRVFRTKQDVIQAYNRGDLDLGQDVEVIES